jgi:methionyl-tRNA formyltransferase
MNIVFFTQDDPFYVKIFFDGFFKTYEHLSDIKAIIISKAMGKKSIYKLAIQMYHFYGFPYFFLIGIRYIYKKIMGKRFIVQCNDKTVKTHTIKQLARSYGIKVIERNDLNSPEFHYLLTQMQPDLSISIASPIIFKEDLINISRMDTINIHNAPLPDYRGMLPNFWQLYHGEKKAGITIHRIDCGIDTGDKLEQHFVPIDQTDSFHDMAVKTKKAGVLLLLQVIEEFRTGTVQYSKIEGGGSYFSFPNRADVCEFIKRGKRVI